MDLFGGGLRKQFRILFGEFREQHFEIFAALVDLFSERRVGAAEISLKAQVDFSEVAHESRAIRRGVPQLGNIVNRLVHRLGFMTDPPP